MNDLPVLPPVPYYFPIRGGRYDTSPGLYPLNHSFGNGPADARLLQIDETFPLYRANKIACRAERFGKYVCADELDPDTAEAVARLLVIRAATEYPTLFVLEPGTHGAGVLRSALTGEEIRLDARARLAAPLGDYRDALDALACQFAEDFVIVRRTEERGEWNAYLHLCAPSLWAAEEKVGRNFAVTHAPVPDFAKVAAASGALTRLILERGPFTRFTWSVAFDDRLNQHPEPPPGSRPVPEVRRTFDPANGDRPYFRVERQVLWGLPEVGTFLFAIRVYVYDMATVRADPDRRAALRSALTGMSPEARHYKGLAETMDRVLAVI